MQKLTKNTYAKCQKSVRVLILFIALVASLIENCCGSSIDGLSLQFNKRGKRDGGEEKSYVNHFVCTSAHEMLKYIKIISRKNILKSFADVQKLNDKIKILELHVKSDVETMEMKGSQSDNVNETLA